MIYVPRRASSAPDVAAREPVFEPLHFNQLVTTRRRTLIRASIYIRRINNYCFEHLQDLGTSNFGYQQRRDKYVARKTARDVVPSGWAQC